MKKLNLMSLLLLELHKKPLASELLKKTESWKKFIKLNKPLSPVTSPQKPSSELKLTLLLLVSLLERELISLMTT